VPPRGQLAHTLKPLVDRGHPAAEIAAQLEAYLRAYVGKPQYLNLPKFAATYGAPAAAIERLSSDDVAQLASLRGVRLIIGKPPAGTRADAERWIAARLAEQTAEAAS